MVPEKLVVGMIAAREDLFNSAAEKLISVFGEIDFTSGIVPFEHTGYYQKEFGSDLKKRFIAFSRLVSPGKLAGIKCLTNLIEKELSVKETDGDDSAEDNNNYKRQINLDPGLLSSGKFVLATTKDQQHRIYLDQGIFAEVTLRYNQGTFRPNAWTYPDYLRQEYIDIFNRIRELYREQLKGA